MNTTVISAFRQAAGYIERYCRQIDELQRLLLRRGDTLRLLLGYGDSTDDSGNILFDECCQRFDCLLLDVSHGGPFYDSIEDPQRFKPVSYTHLTLPTILRV